MGALILLVIKRQQVILGIYALLALMEIFLTPGQSLLVMAAKLLPYLEMPR
jgi:hypothetical protein